MQLVSVIARHERRLRLVFTGPVAAGAFVAARYLVTCVEEGAVDPDVASVLVVADSPSSVELALASNLVQGWRYQIATSSVPGQDDSTCSDTTVILFGNKPKLVTKTEALAGTPDRLLYGEDVLVVDGDFAEGPDGDLAAVSGRENAEHAIMRRLFGAPLQWQPGYSARARESVDAPAASLSELRGRVLDQLRADDRVRDVRVSLQVDESEPQNSTLEIDVTLVGDARLDGITVPLARS